MNTSYQKDKKICIISKQLVKSNQAASRERLHLPPLELQCIRYIYLTYGLLYTKPAESSVITNLLNSFSKTLNLFYPLAGRLVTTNHGETNTITISLDCTNQGAEFVHASAPSISIDDLSPVVNSDLSDLYPMNMMTSMQGHEHPLLSAQVTELLDGIFIACSFNNAVADGSSVWHFINTWSLLSQSGNQEAAVNLPIFKPWFMDSRPLPIHLPRNFTKPHPQDNAIYVPDKEVIKKHYFSFSAGRVAALKAKANEEAMLLVNSSDEKKKIHISSLQALLGNTWKAITRARGLKPDENTSLVLSVGYRTRKIEPPVPRYYFGTMVFPAVIKASAEELKAKSLGWVARSLNKGINSHSEEDVYRWTESWCQGPMVHHIDETDNSNYVLVSNSNKFDVFGNDFGWGKPVGYRTYSGSIFSGYLVVAEGEEKGGIDLVVHLYEGAMNALLEDEEFLPMAT